MAEKKSKETTKEIEKEDLKYSKESLLKSRKLNTNVLSVVLEDGVEYTLEEVSKLVESFMKRSVK